MKEKIAFALIKGIITTGVITFSLSSINVGYNHKFLTFWLKSCSIAYVIGVPVIMFAGPRVQNLVRIWVKRK